MAAARKMDELLVTWLSNDATYDSIMDLIETYKAVATKESHSDELVVHEDSDEVTAKNDDGDGDSQSSPRGVIPPFYPLSVAQGPSRRRRAPLRPQETWDKAPENTAELIEGGHDPSASTSPTHLDPNISVDTATTANMSIRDLVRAVYQEVGHDPPLTSPASVEYEDGSEDRTSSDSTSFARKYLLPEHFVRITKDVFRFPSFFNAPLYQRIVELWNTQKSDQAPMEIITFEMLEWYWKTEMEPFDISDRFFRLVKQSDKTYIERDDFLPFIKALLKDHPGLEFLSSHAEFQEKYAVTVITRIFYAVNKCHSGRITSRQIRRSDLLEAFQQVDEEEDINKVTRYLSYEHFYVLYCRFWELDHDRDYRISREDLLKYGTYTSCIVLFVVLFSST
jgi:hypothetical protein